MRISKRFLSFLKSNQSLLILVVFTGLVGGGLSIFQAKQLSVIVNQVFLEHLGLWQVKPFLFAMFAAIVLRSVFIFLSELMAKHFSTQILHDLRVLLFSQLQSLGPRYIRKHKAGKLSSIFTEGIDALDAYFSEYIPQLFLSALIPISILVVVFPNDLISGLVLLLTAPLIPVFMVLIGNAAQALTQRQFDTLNRLSGHFLESLQGLMTLKYLGRSKKHAASIEATSNQFRDETLKVMRLAFLSAFVLELVATLSTAVIAVEIGIRLLYANIQFEQAFFILILAPEFYLPLRKLGLKFHAGMSGVAAAKNILPILEQTVEAPHSKSALPHSEFYPKDFETLSIISLSKQFEDSNSPLLQSVSFEIKKGQKVALIGESGAGKTSLIDILLGLLPPDSGQILLDGWETREMPVEEWRQIISWVPQSPFIFNASLLENIKLAQPTASEQEVLEACRAANLMPLIDQLPEGLETPIGENGLRLSGGQLQRLAIARATLKNAPLLILDEPTSQLDMDTEQEILTMIEKLAEGKTVLTIAHRRRTLQVVDRILRLENGLLFEEDPAAYLPKVGCEQNLSSDTVLHEEQSEVVQNFENFIEKADGVENLSEFKLIKIFYRLFQFLETSWTKVALAVLLGVGVIAANISLIGTSAWLISAAALQPSIAELQVAIVGVRFFGISRGIFRYLERLVSHDITFSILSRIRKWIYQAIEALVPGKLDLVKRGDLLSRAVSDINSLENFYVRILFPFLAALPVSTASVLYVWSLNPQAGLSIFIAMLFLAAFAPWLTLRLGSKPGVSMVMGKATLLSLGIEGLRGSADLKMFHQEQAHLEKIEANSLQLSRVQVRLAGITGFHQAISLFASNVAMWVVLIIGIQAIQAGQLAGVFLAPLSLITLVSFEAVQAIPTAAQLIGEVGAAARRIFELGNDKLEDDFLEPAQTPEDQGYSSIRFNKVYFKYSGRQQAALQDVSFELPAGKSMAIVGASGAGKSTIANLLFNFWQPDEGEILIDGRKLKGKHDNQRKQFFSIVPQQPFFFNSSIRENLHLANAAVNENDMRNAVEMAQLSSLIESMPNGYETILYENGARLSAGERTRLALARALLVQAPVLILDEPSANLDPITERQIFNTIEYLVQEARLQARLSNVILISHRLIGLDCFDEIIVLDEGRIVERGNHAALMSQMGYYKRLYLTQKQTG